MKTVAILVHGFNVSYPEQTVGKLRPHFEALDCIVEMFVYGHTNLYQVTKRNPKLAKKLAVRIKYWKDKGHHVIVVGHSNGCCITYLATNNEGALPDQVVAINPALQRHYNIAPKADLVQVWYNKGDKAVKWARWLSKIVPERIFQARPWGEMGRRGYKGNAQNLVNFNAGSWFEVKAKGHSAIFHSKEGRFFLPLIAKYAIDKIARI